MAANVAQLWTANSTPAVAAQATASRVAAAGVTHVCKRCSFSVSTIAATAQTPILVNLRDSTTGAGNILKSWSVACLGTTTVVIDEDDLHIVGVAGQAMTLEFAAATVANSQCVANLQGYDL